VSPCLGPINAGKLLLEGVNQGKLKLFWFQDFSLPPEEISVSDIVVFENEEDDYFQWEENELYFEGDLIAYEGRKYASIEDNNEGNPPDQSDNWQEYIEALEYSTYLNSFMFDPTRTEQPEYLHLYLQDSNDEFSIPKYKASFKWDEAITFLNSNNFVWSNVEEGGHLAGPIFQSYSTDLYLNVAKTANIPLKGKDISETLSNTKWKVYQNLAPEFQNEIIIAYRDEGVMTKMPVQRVLELNQNEDPKFLLLGDAISSGTAFGKEDQLTSNLQNVEKIQTIIYEKFEPLDSLILIQGDGRSKMPIFTSGISLADWGYFIDILTEETKNGNWTPYISADLKQEMSVRDFDFRMMIYEEEAIDFAFENDQWSKTVTYYFDDVVEYAGLTYTSLKENNVNHMPTQWPEYWSVVVPEDVEYFYPEDLWEVLLVSRMAFETTGKILSITPTAFCLQVPGPINPSGVKKEIAWYNLMQMESMGDEVIDSILNILKDHEYHADILSLGPFMVANK
ncbi:MAG: hypothetical protein HKN68_19700, partial [Saprospiraceae bacterium]|nr:hypothetical protein [Saprospiraceae bacterium]